jgi:hypothetical protein
MRGCIHIVGWVGSEKILKLGHYQPLSHHILDCAHLSFWRGRSGDYEERGDASGRCASK